MAVAHSSLSNGEIMGLTAKFVDVDGVRTRYYDQGLGEPMVLVHGAGWNGYFNANLWDVNLAGLGRQFRAIAPDKLGSGLTDNPKMPDGYSIEGQMEHFLHFLDTLGLSGIHLIGQSRGAYVAARAALERPELFKTLVLLNTATLAPDDGTYAERRAKILAGHPRGDLGQTLRSRLARLSYSPDHISDEMIAADVYLESLPKAQETKRAWEAGGEALFDKTLAAQKEETLRWIEEGRLRLPTLLYWGKDDPQGLLSQGLHLYDLIAAHNPDARLYVVNQTGHFVFREKPDEFNRVVASWASS